MRITLTGASGFIGGRLIAALESGGHQLHLLGRRRPASLDSRHAFSVWQAVSAPAPAEAIEGADAVIHLAGEPVAQRWTAEAKRRMVESRVEGTRNLVAAIARAARKPKVLVSASAIGYYGSRGDELLTEDSRPGSGFLPELSLAWEKEATAAEASGVRVVTPRIGIVLGAEGGALKKMLLPFRMGVGGRIGDGRQWMSWIHVTDMTGLLEFAATHSSLRGPVNATAPSPVRNVDFTSALATTLHRPALFPVPGFAVRLLFGEMAEIVLGSQRVQPLKATAAGYAFRFPALGPALTDLLR